MISDIEIEKIEKRINWLKELLYEPFQEIKLKISLQKDYCSINEAKKLDYSTIDSGSKWGKEWEAAWFKGKYNIPKKDIDKKIVLKADTGGESLVYIDDKPAAALDRQHGEILLKGPELEPGEHQIMVQSYAGHRVPDITPQPNDIKDNKLTEAEFLYSLPPIYKYCKLAFRNEAAWNLYFDSATLLGIARELPDNNLRKNKILKSLSMAVDSVTWETTEKNKRNDDFKKALEILDPEMKKHNSTTTPHLNLIGHAHIDIAWLWPLSETRRKCGRTFATQLRLMDEYPDYLFLQSQAKAYHFIEKYYPDIFSQIREAVTEGRWEVEGAMWVEPDTNLTSAESLIRQVLYGKQYFSSKFGVDSKVLWLPDVFGYSGNLPQILKGCEVDYFITSKIGWNDTNRFPYDLFRWQGIDGSEVLTHFIKRTYNGDTRPESLQKTWQEFSQPEHSDCMIHSVGHGDGGGGITMEQLEFAKRQNDLEGVPRAKFGSVKKLMEKLAENKHDYPTWRGELYLEFHRGTFTAQAWTKRNNRKIELLLRDAEFFATVAYLYSKEYPAKKLKDCWQKVLTNQFHDVLPGTSIAEVYHDCDRIYGEVAKDLQSIINNSLKEINNQHKEKNTFYDEKRKKDFQSITVWNTLAIKRDDLLTIPVANNKKAYMKDDIFNEDLSKKIGKYQINQPVLDIDRDSEIRVLDKEGEEYESQIIDDSLVISAGEIPAQSCKKLYIENENSTKKYLQVHGTNNDTCMAEFISQNSSQIYRLENKFVKAEIDSQGRLTSFYNKEQKRELIPATVEANQLIMAEDLPRNWDAWDIERYYRKIEKEVKSETSLKIISSGPLESRIRVSRKLGERSLLEQDIILQYNSCRLDFETKINWLEKHCLLKVAFPFDIHTNKALYEIQGGYIERANHDNTSWDRAKFEVSARRWAAIKEPDFGAALLNDCKYGYEALDNELRLTLLTSPTGPDLEADQGQHIFTYSLLAFGGILKDSEILSEAQKINSPYFITKKDVQSFQPFLEVGNDGIELLALKKAESRDSIIIRLCEKWGRKSESIIKFTFIPEEIYEVNMLENKQEFLCQEEREINLKFSPFEIKTLEIKL